MTRELSFMEELLLPREEEEGEEGEAAEPESLVASGGPSPPPGQPATEYQSLQQYAEFSYEELGGPCRPPTGPPPLPALGWAAGACGPVSAWAAGSAPGSVTGSAPGSCSVLILHARVAQKSYGSEKRFFCPPPCVYLQGPGWRRLQGPEGGPAGLVACMGILQEGRAAAPRCEEAQRIALQQHAGMSFGCAKTMFVSDQDKRKHFRLELTLGLTDGREIGSFLSRTIKVISKPSKKKQSIKNAELCIPSGSRVALFNRLRSQTVSTRYLHVHGGGFVASGQQWGAFSLHLVEDSRPLRGGFSLRDGFVRYGASVRLVCPETGLALPTLVIRKVEKQSALLSLDEPVSQLHKCALLLKGSGRHYLCLNNDRIVIYRASACGRDASRDLLSDGACWTIIGTERVEHRFLHPNTGPGHTATVAPVTPIPSVTGLELHGGGDVATLELTGENLGPGLKVWFGAVEADTLYRPPRGLLCAVPDVSAHGGEWRWALQPTRVSLTLARPDGILYPTAYSFTYTPEPAWALPLDAGPLPVTAAAIPPLGHAMALSSASTASSASSSTSMAVLEATAGAGDNILSSIHQEFTRCCGQGGRSGDGGRGGGGGRGRGGGGLEPRGGSLSFPRHVGTQDRGDQPPLPHGVHPRQVQSEHRAPGLLQGHLGAPGSHVRHPSSGSRPERLGVAAIPQRGAAVLSAGRHPQRRSRHQGRESGGCGGGHDGERSEPGSRGQVREQGPRGQAQARAGPGQHLVLQPGQPRRCRSPHQAAPHVKQEAWAGGAAGKRAGGRVSG